MDVEPEDLDKFAKRLKELASQVGDASAYVEKHLSGISGDGILFVGIESTVAETRAALSENIDKLQQLATASGDEMTRAANHYRLTEQTNTAANSKPR
ncbi:type VII secretion target [Gordonia sp. CPCC 206044]|uniref:hypothetical protein n=1 Tax=Gordonia sp. CPCC 206044 TaxID=3140793 RepID=UPI003AF3A187